MNSLTSIMGGGFADVVNAMGWPVSNLAGSALAEGLKALLDARASKSRTLLLEEVRKGNKTLESAADADEFIAIIYRYARSGQEGTARLNLRLMAKVIAGQKNG